MAVSKNDRFLLDKTAKVQFLGGETSEVKISKPNQALQIQGDLTPGEPVYFKISLYDLNLSPDRLDNIETAEIKVTDMNTKGAKDALFERKGDIMLATVPTVEVQQTMHYDVLFLIIIFGVTMFLSQKVMMATSKNTPQDPQQAAIQKSMGTFMPIMIIATFVIIPIPAGVLLYLVTSNIFQIAQTVVVNRQMDVEEANKSAKVDDIDLANAKKVDNKE